MRKELLKGLTDEQIKKVEACKSPDEIIALAKAEGVELTDEQLEVVSGGCGNSTPKKCPECNSSRIASTGIHFMEYKCSDCGHKWIAS